jgi:PAS domain S-box-containing protein
MASDDPDHDGPGTAPGDSREALQRKTSELAEAIRRLTDSEARYKAAMSAGRMGAWETDLVSGTRLWTEEGMALFGISLPGGRGRIGGPDDEYLRALHPDDRHLMRQFHDTAHRQDSFTSEYRAVWPDGSVHWLRGHGQVVARGPDGKAQRMISIVADVTERKAAEDHVAFLMREITHRSKNLLAVVQSIARRTASSSQSIEDFMHRFDQRLVGLAASHDVLIGNRWQRAPLLELLRQQLNPFVDVQGPRVAFDGPAVMLTADTAQALGLAIHELATNAVKYGALSAPAGKVRLTWRYDDGEAGARGLLLEWIEQGGPASATPAQKGFGEVVIQEMARALCAEVEMDFTPQGLHWRIAIPTAKLCDAQD